MRQLACVGVCFGILLMVVGCGSSTSSSNAGSAQSTADGLGPEEVVAQFLAAAFKGDEKRVEALLTPTACERTKEHNLNVTPPSSDTTTFQVGQVELIGEEGAHVASSVTDLDEDGNKHTNNVVWMLRRESVGWRIAGMATRIFEDKPPVVMNFEKPEEMLKEQEWVREEMALRAQAEEQSQAESEKEPPAKTAGKVPVDSKSR